MQAKIRAGLLVNFLPTLEQLGGDIEQVLSRAQQPASVLENPDSYIPFPAYLRLLDAAASCTGYPHFGFLMSRYLGAENFGVAGFIMSQAADVGSAWVALQKFYHIHDSYGVLVDSERNGLPYLRYEIPRYDIPGARQAIDVMAGITINIHRMLCGSRARPEAFHFPYPQPENLDPYRDLECETLSFDQMGYSMILSASSMKLPIEHSDPVMQSLVQSYFATLEDSDSLVGRRQVEKLIRGFLPTGQCTLSHIAQFLSVSVRTLQYKLEVEHSSFQLLLDQVRRERALKHMGKRDMQLTQLAYSLGYSELSAFSRSFKRWYGVSPRAWQKRHC